MQFSADLEVKSFIIQTERMDMFKTATDIIILVFVQLFKENHERGKSFCSGVWAG